MNLFVAGEGVHEIGKWDQSPEYQSTSHRGDGVLATLWRTRHEGSVVGGRSWKNVRKYRAGMPRGDGHALRAFTLDAREADAEVLLWSRDVDRNPDRTRELEAMHATLVVELNGELRIVGGMQNRCIEAWALAIHGLEKKPEELSVSRAEELAAAHGIDTELAMCELIQKAKKPLDTSRSPSLEKWMDQLGPPSATSTS